MTLQGVGLFGAAQAFRRQAEVATHGRGQRALAGKPAFLGDAHQGLVAFAEQAGRSVEAGLQEVLVGREAHAVLELGVEVAGAEAGDLGHLGDTDAPGQVVLDVALQAFDIEAAGRPPLHFAEQPQVEGAQQDAAQRTRQQRIAAVAREFRPGIAQQVLEVRIQFGVARSLEESAEQVEVPASPGTRQARIRQTSPPRPSTSNSARPARDSTNW
ncbi:hypothetical protein D3C80_522950 [compost metagenome]